MAGCGCRRNAGLAACWRWLLLGAVGGAFIVTWLGFVDSSASSILAQQTSSQSLHMLIIEGHGDAAVQQLAELASERGGWGPAPGDVVVFDPTMTGFKRASTLAIDIPPMECSSSDPPERGYFGCDRDYSLQQNLVRFGMYTFVERDGDDEVYVTRPLDDILSVYIEEVGHSWQEYCYETKGRCEGERVRLTTWGEGSTRSSGWEYQVKMYLLNLDGTLLTLSALERAELLDAICDGYAKPVYTTVDTPPPPGWPHPEGWPTSVPSAEAFAVLCGEAF